MKFPIIAYSYTRFSTIEQSRGDSFRRQSEAAEKFCVDRGLVLDTTLKLHDAGISAFKGDNKIKGSFAGFISEIDAGNIPAGSYLIIESLDRLSRQDIDIALTFFMDILRKDIVIATLTDNKIYDKSSLKNLQDDVSTHFRTQG